MPRTAFAQHYETGGVRRMHLRAHQNILKRILLQVGALNPALLIRMLFGVGTPAASSAALGRLS
jgi:transposase